MNILYTAKVPPDTSQEKTSVTTFLGVLATALSSATAPSQVINIIRRRHNMGILDGVSAITIYLVIANCGAWLVYGFTFGAFWTGVLSVLNTIVYLTIATVLLIWGRRRHVLVVAILVLFACVAASTVMSQMVLGLVASAISAGMYFPQAVNVWKAAGTPAIFSYSAVSAWLLVSGSVAWIAYAAMLRDPYVALSCPLIIAAGVMILVSRAKGKKALAHEVPVA